MQKITPFLTFCGEAEEAMNLYTSTFNHSEILSITRYGANDVGKEGTVQQAAFSINGQVFMCIDSFVEHEWTFTPGISLFATCESEEEIDFVFERLSQDGEVLMPLASYPFSKKFAWINDRYGVSWQLSLTE